MLISIKVDPIDSHFLIILIGSCRKLPTLPTLCITGELVAMDSAWRGFLINADWSASSETTELTKRKI